MTKPKLSIIILSHNTKNILVDCLNSLKNVRNELSFEVIVSDNDSTDGSFEKVKNDFGWVKLLKGPNISYSNGNNRARKIAQGKYILFLNSDTVVNKQTIKQTVDYLEKNTNVGAITCKLVLPSGELDRDSRRRFPNPWNSFKRLFLGMGRDYWYADMPEDEIHEVDAIQGAFFLTRKSILDKVNWFDEKYIFDGEDLDLSFQIKKLGYKIIYYPNVTVTHIKKASKNNYSNNQRRMQGVDSMEYFFKKNLAKKYPTAFVYFVLTGIKVLKGIRYIQPKIK